MNTYDLRLLGPAGPACARMTVADYAATVRDLSDQPVFEMSPALAPHPLRGWFEWPDEADPAPQGPMAQRFHSVETPRGTEWWPVNATVADGGRADPIWDTAFAIKMGDPVDPHEPLRLKPGTIPPMLPSAEVSWLRDSCCCRYHAEGGTNVEHVGDVLDIATDVETFHANGMDAQSLDATRAGTDDPSANLAESHLNRTPYCVRLPDEEVLDDEGEVLYTRPRYGDARYIVNMQRRIDWEKWVAQCGPRSRAFFEAQRDGTAGVRALLKGGSPEDVRALKVAFIQRWDESHAGDPTGDEVIAAQLAVNGKKVIDFFESNDRIATVAARYADIDPDPGRVPFHGDPDPKPTRDQYPFGWCWRCYMKRDAVTFVHVNCSIDGAERYAEDVDLWLARQLQADKFFIEYAGPTGLLHLDLDAISDDDEDGDADGVAFE